MRKLSKMVIAGFVGIMLVPAAAHAHIGIASGIGPSLPHPLTPHVGPVYYTPGNKVTQGVYRQATSGPTELDEFLHGQTKTQRAVKKLNCAKLMVNYVMRHGITTPRPLKGFSGCQKWAMDNGYWQARHNTPHLPTNPVSVKQVTLNAEIAVHNVALPW